MAALVWFILVELLFAVRSCVMVHLVLKVVPKSRRFTFGVGSYQTAAGLALEGFANEL